MAIAVLNFVFENELDKEEFHRTYKIWVETDPKCSCEVHSPYYRGQDLPDYMLCARQIAWKNYTRARDKCISVN